MKVLAMARTAVSPVPKLTLLPASCPLESALWLELCEGAPIFWAAKRGQRRIATLVARLQAGARTPEAHSTSAQATIEQRGSATPSSQASAAVMLRAGVAVSGLGGLLLGCRPSGG